MQPKLSLRIASAVMLWHTIGHTIGALSGTPSTNPKLAAVSYGMQTEHFEFMGRSVTLGMFFNGYGFIVGGLFTLLALRNPAREEAS